MNYERLTNEELEDYISRVLVQLEPTLSQQTVSVIQELLEYRNKIEQGTLIEFPRMFKAIDRTGWIVEFIDESDCVCRNHFFHEERAIKRLKELQNG